MKIRWILLLVCLLTFSFCKVSLVSTEWDIRENSSAIQAKQDYLISLSNSVGLKSKPNIILIIADDLGKHEVSAYGSDYVSTPNIDDIGKKGLIFQNAYVTSPTCAPSRAAILTGKYPQRYGFETQIMEFYPRNKYVFKSLS